MRNHRWQDAKPRSATEGRRQWRRLKRRTAAGAIVIAIFFVLGFRFSPNRPTTYSDIRDHFKYGSIGSDIDNGLPLRAMKVLPKTFPEHFPRGGPQDWTAFGFIQESGFEMPIGFSKRRRFIDLIGLNCAACHTGVVRESVNAPPKIFLAMPANTVDLQSLFDFLFRCAEDKQFVQKVMNAMENDGDMVFFEGPIYRRALQLMQDGLLHRRDQLYSYLTPPDSQGRPHPRFGPGRVDTFNPYKVNQFASHFPDGIPEEERYGTVDFPSIWNQKPRDGLQLHWDGNNTSVFERNISAALGAGATRESVDIVRIERIRQWLNDLPAPKYPFPQTATVAVLREGEGVYLNYCFRCHDFSGSQLGRVVGMEEIKTDEGRWRTYTPKLAAIQAEYGRGFGWEWNNFRKTEGYANHPLDGIWTRSPYLHNGSVPTLRDLLEPPANRPQQFDVGHGVYDPIRVGFRTDVNAEGGGEFFRYDTSLRGNHNTGHEYGTELRPEQKDALVEYLKTK